MGFRKSHFFSLVIFSLFCAAISSCMVGPNFSSPHPPHTLTYTGSPLPRKTVHVSASGEAGKAQYFVLGRDIPGEWWALFHSEPLNDLIRAGLANSPNLAAAEAVLIQAKEAFNAQVGASFFPNVTAGLTGERQLFSGASLGSTKSDLFNLFNASVTVAYTLDVFGGLRRQVESLGAQTDNAQFQLEAAYLTLTANIVTTAITIASLRAQIEATHELIRSQDAELSIIEKQFQLGGVSKANVLSQQSQLAQTRATLPPLQQSLAQNWHALSVLIGELPDENNLPKFDLQHLSLPAVLPVSLPSSLVSQRPDIQAAEALLHSASAQIGVAEANLLPQITLNGNYGWESTVASQLFQKSTNIWSFGAGITQPLFNGGSLMAKKRLAIAAYQQAAAQYKQTVLQAFQNVADTLRALQHDAETLRAQKEAEIAAHRSLILIEKQFHLGGVDYLSLLTAERQYQQARISRIQAEASRYNDTAALFQALGGGWWNRLPLECSKLLSRNVAQYSPQCFGHRV